MNAPFAGNIAALSLNNPALAATVLRAEPYEALRVRNSQSDHPVPVVLDRGRERPLHSLVDPVREGERLCRMIREPLGAAPGFMVFSGFGAGYHILPFFQGNPAGRAVVVERDVAFFRRLLEIVDLREILANPRITVMVDEPASTVGRHIIDFYLPALFGGFRSVPLRPRIDMDRDYFDEVDRAIRAALKAAAEDYAVQAAFGYSWFNNIIANLPCLPGPAHHAPGAAKAVVVGAGPSLDASIDRIAALAPEAAVIATDTALSVLVRHGITPDYALCIDCQQVSYHHFMDRIPASTVLVLDLAAPPVVTRRSNNRLFVSGGHPLARLIDARLHCLPRLDTSGGNVGHAAVSLAGVLGAEEVHLFGLDFSYPGGAAYARGTYLERLFLQRQTRCRTLESEYASLIFERGDVRREATDSGFRYTTPLMDAYKGRFEEAFPAKTSELVVHPGADHPRHCHPADPLRSPADERRGLQIPEVRPEDVEGFLCDYTREIEALYRVLGKTDTLAIWDIEEPSERKSLSTLIPLAAFHQQRRTLLAAVSHSAGRPPVTVLAAAAESALRRLRRASGTIREGGSRTDAILARDALAAGTAPTISTGPSTGQSRTDVIPEKK